MTFIFFKYPILKEQASDDLMARKKLPHGRSSHRVFGWSKGGGGKPESSVEPGVAIEWQGGQN